MCVSVASVERSGEGVMEMGTPFSRAVEPSCVVTGHGQKLPPPRLQLISFLLKMKSINVLITYERKSFNLILYFV